MLSILKNNVAWQEKINQIIKTYINNKKHLDLIRRPKKLQNEDYGDTGWGEFSYWRTRTTS